MSNSGYKIAVLGDKDSVLGFKALGLDVFPAETAEEAAGSSIPWQRRTTR